MLDSSKKGIKRPIKSLAYNLPLLVSLAKRLAVNIKDIDLCLGFRAE